MGAAWDGVGEGGLLPGEITAVLLFFRTARLCCFKEATADLVVTPGGRGTSTTEGSPSSSLAGRSCRSSLCSGAEDSSTTSSSVASEDWTLRRGAPR